MRGRYETENEETHRDSDEKCPDCVRNLYDGSDEKNVPDLVRLYVLDMSPEPTVHLKDRQDALGESKALEDGISGRLSSRQIL